MDSRMQSLRYRIKSNRIAQKNSMYGLYLAIPAYPSERHPKVLSEILGWNSDKTFMYLNKMPVSAPIAMSDDGAYCFTSSEDKRRFLANCKKKIETYR